MASSQLRSVDLVDHREIKLMPTFDIPGISQIGMNGARLLALLVLEKGRMSRILAASALWGETSDKRALANLRTALWRINRAHPGLVVKQAGSIELKHPLEAIDVYQAMTLARQLTSPDLDERRRLDVDDVYTMLETLSTDLLADWYEDWAADHRGRWTQLRLYALESLAEQLIDRRLPALAIEAMSYATSAEPLRESSHRLLIQAHISNGNRGEAIACHRNYRTILDRALGVEPSQQMAYLMAQVDDGEM